MRLIQYIILLSLFACNSFADDRQDHSKRKHLKSAEIMVTNPYTGEIHKVQRGAFATVTIRHIAELNKLLQQPDSENSVPVKELIGHLTKLIPALKAYGAFDLFDISEWLSLSKEKQWGRVLCALLYLEHDNSAIDEMIKDRLKQLKKKSPPAYIAKQIELLLK